MVTLRTHLRRSFPRYWQRLHTLRKDIVEYPHWSRRISEVKKCPDNARIPRVNHAGKTFSGLQLMHNGIPVLAGSYYGRGGQRLLRQNRGCHEPQEEFIFSQVLRLLPLRALILECGAYWGFYSLWFCKEIPDAVAYLIEPDSNNLEVGRRNFELNGFEGRFFQHWIGSNNTTGSEVRNTATLDALTQEQSIGHIDILHADIQGAELDLLLGAHSLLANQRISFLFISTHSEQLHVSCETLLHKAHYDPFISIPPTQSYSFDGLLVARNYALKHISFEQPSKKYGVAGMEFRI
jgi:methyltransferase FkbM-like protein